MTTKLKKILKNTYLFQFKKCFDEYVRRCNFVKPISGIDKIKRASNYRVIKEKGISSKDKINQIDILLKKTKIDTNLKYGFFYSLDEMICIYHSGIVIDNMPCDYDFLITHSIEEMKGMGCDKSIRVNTELLVAIETYINKVCSLLKEEGKQEVATIIENIAKTSSNTLRDALQRILFWNQILWQTNHRLVGLGRLDKTLDKYEIDENSETLIKNFLLAIHCYYIYKSSAMAGDTGQVIVVGGTERNGEYFCNEYTYLILKAIMQLNLPDPKVVLRVSKKTPDYLLDVALQSISLGIGSPLLSNDDVVVPAMLKFGYDVDDSFDYSVSACWEPLPSTDSLEQNNLSTLDLGRVLTEVIHDNAIYEIDSLDDFMNLFKRKLHNIIQDMKRYIDSIEWNNDPLMTLCSRSCRDSGNIISNGGSKNKNYGFLTVGMSSVVNSMINLKSLVFDECKYDISDLIDAARCNFVQSDRILFDLKTNKRKSKFGSDSNEAIYYTNQIIQMIYEEIVDYRNKYGGRIKFGLSSPAYIMCGKSVDATLDGRKLGEPFSTHISSDTSEAFTELILFASKIDYFSHSGNGNVVDIVLNPGLILENKFKFLFFIKTSIRLGFFQMQFNVLSYEQLMDAKSHPEKYPNLIVRVWGFSAYFNDLSNEYKELLINRALKSERRTLI